MTNNTSTEIIQTLRSAKKVLLSLHLSPDGDSLASCQAFSRILTQLGVDHTVISPEPTPSFLDKLVDNTNIMTQVVSDMDLSEYDIFLSLDMESKNRCTNNAEFTFPNHIKTINIDHHPQNKMWGDMNYVDTSAAANCCVLYDLFKAENIAIDTTTAKYLMIGIYTDSGSYQNSNTNSHSLRITADLMDIGVNFFEIVWTMKYNEDMDSIRFKALVYKNVVYKPEKGYAYTTISLQEEAALGIKKEGKLPTASDFIKYLKDIDYAFVIKEKLNEDDGSIYFSISFRSHTIGFDVSALAKKFGGGGHKPAAAALIKGYGSIPEVLKYVEETLAS